MTYDGFSDLDPDTGMTIGVEFQISMYAVSGLRVDSLRLFHEGYKPYKVRMIWIIRMDTFIGY